MQFFRAKAGYELSTSAKIAKLSYNSGVESIVLPKKRKKDEAHEPDLWIAPKYSLKGPTGERAWDNRMGGVPSNSRYLELADLALGRKKPEAKKKSQPVHETIKREPYSR